MELRWLSWTEVFPGTWDDRDKEYGKDHHINRGSRLQFKDSNGKWKFFKCKTIKCGYKEYDKLASED